MLTLSTIKSQLPFTLAEINLPERFGAKISGKVRESYVLGDKRIIIATDRLSAFDRILTTIPFKGQLLNQMTAYWFKATEHIIENHVIEIPHPYVFIVKQAKIIPIEVVVRGYLAGSAWRDYQAGRSVSGITLPKGLRKAERFERAILTPSTKAEHGEHDEPITREEVLSRGLVEPAIWEQVEEKALELFNFASLEAKKRGLILVDTKYEFALLEHASAKPRLILADEIHTQDSSRYWIADSYQERFERGEDPVMLDKEFVRSWLISKGYMGEGTPPVFADDFRAEIAERYIKTCEMITGAKFEAQVGDTAKSIMAWADCY